MRGREFSGLSPSTQAEKKEGAVIERRNVLAAGLAWLPAAPSQRQPSRHDAAFDPLAPDLQLP